MGPRLAVDRVDRSLGDGSGAMPARVPRHSSDGGNKFMEKNFVGNKSPPSFRRRIFQIYCLLGL